MLFYLALLISLTLALMYSYAIAVRTSHRLTVYSMQVFLASLNWAIVVVLLISRFS